MRSRSVPALVLAGLLIACIRMIEPSRRWFALLSLGFALAFFLACRWCCEAARWSGPSATGRLSASRYFILPVLFLLVAFLLAVDVLITAPASRKRTAALVGIGIWLALLAIANYSFTNGRSAGPEWRSSLRTAKERCIGEAPRRSGCASPRSDRARGSSD